MRTSKGETIMTDYENKNGQVTDEQIKAYVEDYGYEMTDNLDEALYILRDGSMISGGYDMGIRGEDHNMIVDLISEGVEKDKNSEGATNFWKALHQKTSLVRVVPETNSALIATGQQLTAPQRHVIDELGYRVEEYIK